MRGVRQLSPDGCYVVFASSSVRPCQVFQILPMYETVHRRSLGGLAAPVTQLIESCRDLLHQWHRRPVRSTALCSAKLDGVFPTRCAAPQPALRGPGVQVGFASSAPGFGWLSSTEAAHSFFRRVLSDIGVSTSICLGLWERAGVCRALGPLPSLSSSSSVS